MKTSKITAARTARTALAALLLAAAVERALEVFR